MTHPEFKMYYDNLYIGGPVPAPVNNEVLQMNEVNTANAYETNAELPNSNTTSQILQSNSNMKVTNYRLKIKNPIRRNFSKNAGTPKKATSQYFQAMTGLTPRGIHVARKTRKNKKFNI